MLSPSFLEQMKHYGVALAVLFVVFGVGVAVGKPFGPLTGQTADNSLCYYTKIDGACGTLPKWGSVCPDKTVADPSQVPACNTQAAPVSCTGTECANGGDSFCAQQGEVCQSSPDVPCIVCVKPASSSAASVGYCCVGGTTCAASANCTMTQDKCSATCGTTPPAPSSWIIDDSDTTYFRGVPSLEPNTTAPAAYNSEDFVAPAGKYTVADWDFAQVPAGSYDIYASWPSSDKNDTAVTYTALQPAADGTMTTLFAKSVDQTQVPTPDRMTAAGVTFQKIGSVSFTGLPPIVEVSGVPKSQYSLDAVMMAVPLSISKLDPSTGPVGTTVTITGTGFDPTNNTVQFAFEFNKFEHIPSPDGKHLIFTVPAQIQLPCQSDPTQTCSQSVLAGSYDVSVQIGSQTSNKLTFTVTAASSVSSAPASSSASYGNDKYIEITKLSPDAGPVGTSVTITGTGFSPTGNVVNFSGSSLDNIASLDGTHLTFTVPVGPPCPAGNTCAQHLYAPGKYPVSVWTDGVITQSNQLTFTVTASSSASSAGASSSAVSCTNKDPTGRSPLSVAIGDLNGDGKADMVVANENDSTVSVYLNAGNGQFAPKADYPTGSLPWSVAINDLNGDGKPDLAVANGMAGTVSVLLNNGDGTFASKIDYKAGTWPLSVAIGDLNGDGRPDLVTANETYNTAAVLMNTGNGTFAPKIDLPTASTPYSVTIGDFNGDGAADLAIPDASSNVVSVFLNSGTGAFAAKVDYPTGVNPQAVAMGDLNGDGTPDLVVTNIVSKTVSVLMNSGRGTFASKVDYPTGTQPWSVAIGDLNGDGFPDLAVANKGDNTVSVFLNHSGIFPTKVDYPVGTAPYSVAIGDLNGDGAPDLAVANSKDNTVSTLWNGGDGTFNSCAAGSSSAGNASFLIGPLSPPTGPAGTQVSFPVQGYPTQSESILPGIVHFGDTTVGASVSGGGTSVSFIVPEKLGPGAYPVSLQVGSQTSNTLTFTITSGTGLRCTKDTDCPQPLTDCKIGGPCPHAACVNGQCVLIGDASSASSSASPVTELDVAEQNIGSSDTAVKNQKNIVLDRFQAQPVGGDERLTGVAYAALQGSLLNAQNYTLWVDTNGDGIVDTILQKGVSGQYGTVILNDLSGGGYVMHANSTTYFELHADVAGSLSSNVLQVGFRNDQAHAEDATSGAPSKIQFVSANPKVWTLASAGSLFVTKDTQPRSHQLLGGAVGAEILRVDLRAQDEDINVTKLHILVAGNGAQDVDALLLYKMGEQQPFATATVAATASDSVPSIYQGMPAKVLTAVLTSRQLVVKNGQTQVVSVVPRMKSDTDGAVSGHQFRAVIYGDNVVNDQTGEGAVHAVGIASGNALRGNSGANPPDGEIFIGTNTPASNSDIVGPMEQTVLSKITSVVNANPDPDGTAVPTGVYAVAQFAFTAATNTNALNGLNKAVLSGVIFDVQSTNVQFDDSSFRFMNLRTQSASAPCVVMDSHGTIITGTTVGSFLVACNGLTSSSVDTSIASGQSQSFGLEANIINSQVGTGNAGLLVSITNFSSITANGYGPNSSHLQWIDRDAASANLFNWIEYPSTVIRSTQYGAGSGGQKALACKTDSDCPQPDCIANNNCPHEACINGQCTLQTMHQCTPIDCPAPRTGCHYTNATADSFGCPLSCGTLVCQPQQSLLCHYFGIGC